MKTTKRILTLFACVCLLCSALAMTASAAGTASITIKNPTDSNAGVAGKTLNLFKIFNATISGTNIAYSWNTDVVDEDGNPASYEDFFFNAAYNDGVTPRVPGGTSIYDAVGYVASFEAHSLQFSQMASDLHDYIHAKKIDPIATSKTQHPTGIPATETSYTFDNLDLGYYMVYDATDLENEETAVRSAAMLTTANADVEVTLKANRPTIEKYVYDADSTPNWQLGTTASIGDEVQFQLLTEIPDHAMYGTEYKYKIHDDMSADLALVDGSIEVKIAGVLAEEGVDKDYTLTLNPAGTTDFTITFNNAFGLAKGTKIEVLYKGELKETTTLTHMNTATLEYSNDPGDLTSLGSTSDAVNVYTYHSVLVKRIESTAGVASVQRLGNAAFEVYKDGGATPLTFRKSTYTDANGKSFEVYVYAPDGGAGTVTELETYNSTTAYDGTADNGGAITTSSGGHLGEIAVIGLAEGEYVIKETKVPDGYIEPAQPFEITLTDIIGPAGAVADIVTSTSAAQQTGGQILASADESILHVWIGITNRPGTPLPDTGGMGTTLFTVAGIVLMAGAIAFFTLRKRNSAA